jgi:hypothetical protein
MIKYKKLFGIIRILLGMLFFIYPAYEFFQQGGIQSEESMRWLFVFIFFLVYAYSAIRNGIREIGGLDPAFNLPRFFEASMNGFISIYIIILLIVAELNGYAKFLLFILTLLTLISMIRDLRYISLQYYDKKQRAKK